MIELQDVVNIDELAANVDAIAAVVFYGTKDGRLGYAESFKIEQGAACSGIPLSEDFLKNLVSNYTIEVDTIDFHCKGKIPPTLMSITNDTMMWYNKPQKRWIHYKDGKKSHKNEVKLPYLVFSLRGKSIYIHATKKNPKNGKAKMYRAPFPNTSSNGSVCMGNVKIHFKSYEATEVIKYIEEEFFNSYFTHGNSTRSNTFSLYKKGAIPNSELI